MKASFSWLLHNHSRLKKKTEIKHIKIINLMRDIYTMEYYSVMKKNEIMPFGATWMALEIIILSEANQKEKDKYHVMSLKCGI